MHQTSTSFAAPAALPCDKRHHLHILKNDAPRCTAKPPPPRKRPRPSDSRPTLARRSFLRLLLATPLASSLVTPASAHEELLDLEPKDPELHAASRFGWIEGSGRFTEATTKDYEEAWQVGHGSSDVARMARVYLARAGVTGFVAAYCAAAMSISERQARRTVLPSVYDPVVIARYWQTRPDKVVYRMGLFACEIVKYGLTMATDLMQEHVPDKLAVKSGMRTDEWRMARRIVREERRAILLREAIIRLGAAVIKLGQAAASRPDLFGGPVVRELQKLQDDVVAFYPTSDAFGLIYDELGATPAALFESIEMQPVAGASLGMVFKATVDGTPVAVKVQRPEVAENIALDCYIVRCLAHVATLLLKSRTDFRQAVDEYASRLFEELDYTNELRNMDKFRQLYGHLPGIYLPKAFPTYCSRKVLVTEWVDGVKLIDEQARVRAEDLELVETGIRFALTQLLDKGFLHADMHNGNMLRTKSGYLAYIDFGLVSEVPASVRESIVCALMHLIHGEYARLAESFSGLALMRSDDIEVDLPVLSEALREAFEPSNEALAASRKRGVSRFNNFTLVGIVGKLLMLGTRFPFVFNDYFLNNFRCLGMLEGLALNADPNFNVLGVVYPYVVKKILTDPKPRYRRALESLVIDPYGRMRWSRMDQLLQDVQDTASTTMGEYAEPMTQFILSKSKAAVEQAAKKESRNATPKDLAPEHDSENERSAGKKKTDEEEHTPDLVISFMTSNSGRFLRQYIIQRYISNLEFRWRARIDSLTSTSSDDLIAADALSPSGSGSWNDELLHRMALQATARELSDDEAQLRTRQFFRHTPLTKRCRVLLRLAPGFVLPLVRMLIRIAVYFVTKVFAPRTKRQVVVVGPRSTMTGRRSADGTGVAGVERWSFGEEGADGRRWEPFESDFLRRTQAASSNRVDNR